MPITDTEWVMESNLHLEIKPSFWSKLCWKIYVSLFYGYKRVQVYFLHASSRYDWWSCQQCDLSFYFYNLSFIYSQGLNRAGVVWGSSRAHPLINVIEGMLNLSHYIHLKQCIFHNLQSFDYNYNKFSLRSNNSRLIAAIEHMYHQISFVSWGSPSYCLGFYMEVTLLCYLAWSEYQSHGNYTMAG